ncbi:MAG TPA: ribosome maturation factor RimM [Bauldia sp.]|nr:ribosome maturation factor RimM [Bauldia sp.]
MILVAQFGAAHGIKGEVRLKSFTQDPFAVADYGPLTASDGRRFEIEAVRAAAGSSSPDMLIVRLKGVRDRNAAEALTGLELRVPQDRLPPAEEGEYYHADLIGLTAVTPSGTILGTVVGAPNYGAGDLLEIAPKTGNTILVPFSDAVVPEVDIAGGRVVVDPPRGLLDEVDEEEGDEA